MKQMFRTHARNIEINPSNNVLDILVKLYDDYIELLWLLVVIELESLILY